MTTPIFTPEQVIQYAKTRLFSSLSTSAQPDTVQEIRLYNALLPSELERLLTSPQQVYQENGREPIYYTSQRVQEVTSQEGPVHETIRHTLHIPQYSGFGRRKRYEELIKAYLQASGKNIVFTSLERDNDHRKTNIFYDNFAYDFVKGLFLSEDMLKVSTIIIGPTSAVAKAARTNNIHRRENEYLESQVLELGSSRVLNLGYVYADQAGIIVDKMMREYEALARKERTTLRLSIYMFGRVGGLDSNLRRHDLVFPTGIVDEVDLQQDLEQRQAVGPAVAPRYEPASGPPPAQLVGYPMLNVLAAGGYGTHHQGLNFNVSTVINETVEQLQAAQTAGCICVEMETRETVESINRARRRYAGTLDIQFGFVGYVSDLPLQGDTLARELESEEGERKAVGVIMDFMEKDQRKDAQGGRR